MNMFRNILTVVIFALGTALWFVPTDQWKWLDFLGNEVGGQAIMAVDFLERLEPFSTILCLVIATALFMTRKQY